MLKKLILIIMMNLPKFIQLKLSKKAQIELQGRKLLPSFQLMLSIPENELEVDYEILTASDFRNNYDEPNPMSFYSSSSDNMKTKDHELEVDNGSVEIREYLIENSSNKALLYFHGGGFTSGNLESHDNLCKYLAFLLGIKVFSLDYRRSPEYKFPIPLDDCNYAFEWLINNSKKFKLDPSKIYTGGDSAGGNLSAALCLARRDANKTLPYAQFLLYPVTDLRMLTESYTIFNKGFLLTRDMMHWFKHNYLNRNSEETNPLASPLLAQNFKNLPSSVIVTAGFDPLRDEGQEYFKQLQLAGVNVIHKEQKGFVHAFAQFGIIPECRSAIKEACDDLLSF